MIVKRLLNIIVVIFFFWKDIIGQVGQNGKDNQSINPSHYLENPYQLTEYKLDTPIPLSSYTPQELALQDSLNQHEDLIVTSSKHAVRVGEERYFGINSFDITPYTWKWVHLKTLHDNPFETDIILRRPNHWIEAHQLNDPGNKTLLRLPGYGFEDSVQVVAHYPNTFDSRLQISDMSSDNRLRPVVGYLRKSSDTVNMYEFSNGEVLESTPNHVIWSETQGKWIEIDSLAINEEVYTSKGSKTYLINKSYLEQPSTVYNIEVYRDHNYFVGEQGILVHNSCIGVVLRRMFPDGDDLKRIVTRLKNSGVFQEFVDLAGNPTALGNRFKQLAANQQERLIRDVLENPALAKELSKNPELVKGWKALTNHRTLRADPGFLDNIKALDDAVLDAINSLDNTLLNRLKSDLASRSNGRELKRLLKNKDDLDKWKLLKEDPAHAFELAKDNASKWTKWSKANFFKEVTKRGKDFEALVTAVIKTKPEIKPYIDDGFQHVTQVYIKREGSDKFIIADDLFVKPPDEVSGSHYFRAVINDSKLNKGSPWTPNQRSELIDIFKNNPNQKFIEFKVRSSPNRLRGSPLELDSTIRIYRDEVFKTISDGNDAFGEIIKVFKP